ncbi:TadE/TadG family type IV pilus assembly protein [Microterricola viridarii]|uniref:Pilus assembly protein TadE n=1 Tax=Microterricola viridarii TaxID=412690 RepID=A0A0Y0MI16_9MICO|nr:TadE/TadG family type IV pilus assembly protein [Microterricola viridarii]AMB58045.1 pilus assembly protein TadE [Microterricola viridarii]
MAGGLRHDERGSALAEFTMVAALLTLLCLAVIQLALALHIRNTVQDAAAEGARLAALAGATLDDGAQRTRELISIGIGPAYATHVTAGYTEVADLRSTEVRVVTPLPVIGLFGIESALEVTGHAALELPD